MSNAEVEAYQKDSVIGHRPTWKAGANAWAHGTRHGGSSAETGSRASRPACLFSWRSGRPREAAGGAPPPQAAGAKSLDALDLPDDGDAGRDQSRASRNWSSATIPTPMAATSGPRTSCAKSSKPITISSRLGSSEAGIARPDFRKPPSGAACVPSTWKNIRKRDDMRAQAQAGVPGLPDMKVSVRQLFGIDTDLEVPAYSKPDDHVPDIDNDYVFNREVTLAILAGFKHNRRVMIQGYHGTGKSTHIEQVAARLNWPCIRVNLDSHVSRIDLVGKDAIVLKDGKQVTEFREGMLPYCPADQHGAVLRRVRRRPARRDVRDPARAGAVGQADPARSVEGDPAAPGVPPVLHHQHHRPRRHLGPLSRHPADQPGPDGPLVDRGDAQLPAARRGGARSCWPRPSPSTRARPSARSSPTWCGSPT